jgi:putative toxin-antitoxin system antitoxin component (TIGR02293 family)
LKRRILTSRIFDLHYFSGFTYEEIAESTGLSRRRVRHLWELGSNWLKEKLKARPLAYEVIQRAVEVMGDEPEAMRWLSTPTRALDYATPVSLLHTQEGIESVLVAMGRFEHGVL